VKTVYTVYVLDTEKYIDAESIDEVLALARARLAEKGIPLSPPLCLDARPVGAPPMDMHKRYKRIYADPHRKRLGGGPDQVLTDAPKGSPYWLN
jgi:hypothetical protein